MNIVAVIPARGGSKGVPAKNLRPVGGVPLIVRAVIAAQSSHLVDSVVVSTDDYAIGLAARSVGARIIDRPAAFARDESSSESALLHAIGSLPALPDVLVFIQATSPFIDAVALDDAIVRVRDGVHDVVFSATETYEFLWTASASGINHDPASRPRRQDREPHYRETGAFYVMDVAGFMRAGHRFFGNVGIARVDDRTALEIDTVEELELANAIAPFVDRTATTVSATVSS
jgi:CMP-N-acetylneuraminic acid synthetase